MPYDVSNELWDVQDVECLRCITFGMWNVLDVRCLGCRMFGMWNVGDVGCLGCGMFEMWDVRDVGCSGCGMWDVGCLLGCGMLIYKMLVLIYLRSVCPFNTSCSMSILSLKSVSSFVSQFPHVLFGLSSMPSILKLFYLDRTLRSISLSSIKTGSS